MFSVYRIVAFVSIFRCWCHSSTHTKPIADLILGIKKPQLMRSIGVSGFLSFLMFWGGIKLPATWIRKSGIR